MTTPQEFVNIERLSIKGITIDPTHIVSLDIFESLDSFGITGRITVQDWSAIKEIGNVFAGDSFKVTFGRKNDPPLELDYVIYESQEYMDDENLYPIITYGFCSKWYLEAITRKRSKPYRNMRVDEIIADIVQTCGGELLVVEPTRQVLDRFVSPYWSPIFTLNFLLSFAESENGHGGYLLWTDIENERVNLVPVYNLMAGDYGEVGYKMVLNNTYQRSMARVFQQSMDKNFNVMKDGDMGLAHSQLIGFNYDNTTIMQYDQRLDDYNFSQAHLGTRIPLNEKYLGKRYRNTRFSHLFYNTDSLIQNIENTDPQKSEEMLAGRLHNKYTMATADLLKINVSSPGEGYRKRAGRLIQIQYPSIDDGRTAENKNFSGWYLIKNVRHSIQGMQYKNTISLVSNAYKNIERIDMIDIQGSKINGIPGINTNFIEGTEFEGDIYDSDNPSEFLETEKETTLINNN